MSVCVSSGWVLLVCVCAVFVPLHVCFVLFVVFVCLRIVVAHVSDCCVLFVCLCISVFCLTCS